MRRWMWILPILLVLTAVPAWAEEAAEGGEKAGVMDLSLATIIATIVVFLVLLVVLSKTAWKPILDGLQKREATIRKAVEDAEEASRKATALVAEYEAKLHTATDEARQIADEARRDAEDAARRIQDDARKAAEETTARSVREIEQAKDKAYEELLRDVATIATETASRIVKRNLDADANADLVEEVVRDYARQGGSA